VFLFENKQVLNICNVLPKWSIYSNNGHVLPDDIAEILLKVALNTINQINSIFTLDWWLVYINNCSLFPTT
jgi:hypothetical protein